VTGEGASGGDAGGGGVTGEEAAWRDLVARYEMPAEWDAASVPWPDRENLTERSERVREGGEDAASGPDRGPSPASPASTGGVASGSDGGVSPASPGRAASPASTGGVASGSDGGASPASPGGASPTVPDRTRVIRPATPPPGPAPKAPEPVAGPPEDEDEHFVPPPPPPLPQLDPIAKGAWVALFGGPAYLVLASIIGWTVPGWAALVAVMAFVGGFAIVVLRLGDGPSRGDGPDSGAVILSSGLVSSELTNGARDRRPR
jgi:hypothetical protein